MYKLTWKRELLMEFSRMGWICLLVTVAVVMV